MGDSQVDVVEEDILDEETGTRMCRTPGDEGCTFVFKYQYYNNRGDIGIYKIQAQKERTCPTPVNVLGSLSCPANYTLARVSWNNSFASHVSPSDERRRAIMIRQKILYMNFSHV